MNLRQLRPERDLRALLAHVGADAPSMPLSDLTLDSRTATPGSAFLACRGRAAHGLDFAPEAVARGAQVVLWEPAPSARVPDFPSDIVVTAVPNLGAQAGVIADRFFGTPSARLRVFGITGTNGKTTCAYVLAQALENAGVVSSYIGTIGIGRPGALTAAQLTTADAVTVHRVLAREFQAGADAIAMEVSSHALDQQRVAGVRFEAAAFTNLTRDHLDYHRTMQAYGAAKARLFAWSGLRSRVINVDDAFGAELVARGGAGRLIMTTRATCVPADARQTAPNGAWVCLRAVTRAAVGLHLEVETSWGPAAFDAPFVGDFNVENLLTVFALLLGAGIEPSAASRALAQAAPPPGRMEIFGGRAGAPLAIVDYAHTPDALAKALRAAREHCAGRLWVVFGCGGERDPGKRPVMGQIAEQLADAMVLTDDNPRSESPQAIVTEIAAGLSARANVHVEHDRAKAIQHAISAADARDAVLVAGKGHEDYQIYGTVRRAFSDQAAVQQALTRRQAVHA